MGEDGERICFHPHFKPASMPNDISAPACKDEEQEAEAHTLKNRNLSSTDREIGLLRGQDLIGSAIQLLTQACCLRGAGPIRP